jgi:vitamin B12 transporter
MLRRLAAALATAGLLGGWSPLAAQSSTQKPPTFSSTLVVTASVEPETREDLAATVDVVDREEIETRQANLVLDLLRELPGLAVTQSGSPGKLASVFSRGTSSSQTLVLLDGVVLNDPVLGAFDWSTLATDGLDRVEVARGPFSALWGSGAVGGVVQLITRTPDRARTALRLEGGSDSYRRAGADAAAPLGNWGLDVAGHSRRGEGVVDNDFFDSDGVRARLELAAAGRGRLGLLADAGEATVGLPYDYFGTPSPERRQRSRSRLWALPASWSDAAWRVEAEAARHDTHLAISDPNDPFAASTDDARRDQLRATVRRELGGRGWLAAGFEEQRESASSASAFGAGLDDAHATTRAAFAQGSWAPGRLRLDLGVRRDDHSAFGGATSLKAGAVVALGSGARLRASYGESFRAPSLGDLYFPGFGNPDLRPERGRSWELGVEGGSGALTARLVAFDNELENLIQFDLLRGLPYNIGRARSRGLEAGLELRRGGWHARAGATWLDAEDRVTGEPLPRRPEASGDLVADWSGRRAGVGASVRWVGPRRDVGGVPLAGYVVSDLVGSWTWSARVASYARVENAFGRSYQEAFGYPAPGRRWVLGLSLRGGGG